jgi:hypothetical protein
MLVMSCPKCGTRRVGAFRFCLSCGFDFDLADAAGDGLLDGGEEVRIGTHGRCQGAFHVDPEARCEFFRRHTEEARQVRDDRAGGPTPDRLGLPGGYRSQAEGPGELGLAAVAPVPTHL